MRWMVGSAKVWRTVRHEDIVWGAVGPTNIKTEFTYAKIL